MTPNASLGGQMEKYWDLMHKTPILVKESYKYYGQQSINEVFASIVHSRQPSNVEFVRYTAEMTEDRGVQCKCPAFTSENIELLSAYEMVESRKTKTVRHYMTSTLISVLKTVLITIKFKNLWTIRQ